MFLGDNMTCDIFGISEIRLEMFDGVIRNLRDFRFFSWFQEKSDISWAIRPFRIELQS